MVFISTDDFFTQVSAIQPLSRDEEEAVAVRVSSGDEAAREALVRSYLPLVASHIRRAPWEICTLHTVYACIATVEKSIDSFKALGDRKAFTQYLGWGLRQCITRCIAYKF